MTLVDTSVWVHFFRSGDERLAELLETGAAAIHDFILGELACGNLRHRQKTLADLRQLPRIRAAETAEVMFLVEHHRLQGRGLGWVDVHLLAAAGLAQAGLYTRDGALAKAALELAIASDGSS